MANNYTAAATLLHLLHLFCVNKSFKIICSHIGSVIEDIFYFVYQSNDIDRYTECICVHNACACIRTFP